MSVEYQPFSAEVIKEYGITEFDVAEFLTDEETIQAYLAEMLENGTEDEYLAALSDVARARRMNVKEKTS